jgi:undecaprenyl-diphosphatase
LKALRRAGASIAEWARFHAGGENRAAGILILIGFVLTLSAIFVFREIAEDIRSDEVKQFDVRVLQRIHEFRESLTPTRRDALDDFFQDVTALGGTTVLTLFTIFVALFLKLAGRGKEALLTVIVSLGCLLLSTLLKGHYLRPRPEVFARPDVHGWSFPSGHSMSSMAIWLTQGVLLARLAPTWSARVFATGAAIVLAMLVAMSRMWIGVHYLTDVTGGALCGLAWALTVLCADEVFRRERARIVARVRATSNGPGAAVPPVSDAPPGSPAPA